MKKSKRKKIINTHHIKILIPLFLVAILSGFLVALIMNNSTSTSTSYMVKDDTINIEIKGFSTSDFLLMVSLIITILSLIISIVKYFYDSNYIKRELLCQITKEINEITISEDYDKIGSFVDNYFKNYYLCPSPGEKQYNFNKEL